ncbi:PAS domain S-box protein [Marinobacter daepoensis]|uniref:histidine kinase n=1 Tax=Marinobacter daepoensis TaxID=262077 RepID=A0ABS3BB46_9GAMM|nr:PAS domain S-box protein [Marinobacter daepoensis]MBN7769080.1 PAS domain S-box protein [Marinobacter daepoensis]MBY6077770.1 PAS domain S-box protein [Marinobacter daepoensis]
MSFRWKTVLGVGLIELFFLSVLVWQAISFIRVTYHHALEERARDTLMLASSVIVADLISVNVASLQAKVHQIRSLGGVDYVRIRGFDRVLATAGISSSEVVTQDRNLTGIDDGRYDQSQDIVVGGQHFGAIEMGLSLSDLEATLAEAKLRFYVIAALELLLVALVSLFFARYLTRELIRLRSAAHRVAKGEEIEPILSSRNDELSETVAAFNQMLGTLKARETALQNVNDELIVVNDELQRKESETTALLEAAPDGIATLDEEENVVFANPAMAQLLGVDASELMGQPLAGILDLKGLGVREWIDRQSRNPNTWFESTIIDDNGAELMTEMNLLPFESGERGRYILIVRDRTHTARLERDARVSERLKASLIDASLDALITIDKRGKVTDFSQSAEVMFGWARSELTGQDMASRIVPAEYRDAHHKGFARYLATGEGPLIGKRIETYAVKKNGEVFPVELSLTAVRIDEEVFVTANIRDISDRKSKEEELLAAKESAEDASRAKSRFLSHMSHEIRSPLTAVLGSLSLLEHRGSLEPKDLRFLQMARRSGDALLQVVNEILDFSRIEAGETEYQKVLFSPRELVGEVFDGIAAHRQKSSVLLIPEVSSAVPELVKADRDHLRQVLTILVDNAVKFTEEGHVMIEVTSLESDDSGCWLRINVNDTGPGIPDELVESAFSEFGQVDAARDRGFGGSGLGLAIARQLVTGMNGAISLTSTVGQGSTFSLSIPYEVPSNEDLKRYRSPPDQHSEPLSPPSGNDSDQKGAPRKRVLLVDDVDANLLIGAEMLKSRGFDVETARDGAEAVRQAESKHYDAILMDLRMPNMNGLEATETIRQSGGINAQTPIIAVTANAEKSEIERCKRTGMNDFVSKPFNLQRLVQTVYHCLDNSVPPPSALRQDGQGERAMLSQQVLEQLALDTSEASLPLMISVFINEIKKRMQLIDSAIGESDYSELREQAHALKSCSGTFGGMQLHHKAQELELLLLQGRHQSVKGVIDTLRANADETVKKYESYLKALENASGQNL